MRSKPHNFAFTLVELIMVLAIVAVLCAIVAPSLSGFTRGRLLPNTATMLAATAQWCRTQAISEGTTYRLNFEPNAENLGVSWWVTRDEDGDGLNWTEVTNDEMGRRFILPDGVGIVFDDLKPVEGVQGGDPGGLFISFDAGGTCDVTSLRVTYDTAYDIVTCDTPLSTYRALPPGREVGQ